MDLATLVALGIPALLAAIAYAVKKLADARLVNAEAARTHEDTAKTKADTDKADADTTGRIVVGREADAETIRDAFASIQGRLDRCETRHEVSEKRHDRERETWRVAMAAKDAQIDALWSECRSLRAAIEGASA